MKKKFLHNCIRRWVGFGQHGFTLVELLAVTGILAVLSAASFFGLSGWSNHAHFVASENGAKTIFYSAQSALTYMESSGALDEFFLNMQAQEVSVTYEHDGERQTRTVFALNNTEQLRTLLRPYIYDTVVLENAVCVEIDKQTRTVFAVFYSEQAASLTYGAGSGDRTGAVSMADRSYEARKPLGLGYYSAEDIANVKSPGLTKLKVTTLRLVNGEQLLLQWASNASPEQVVYDISLYRDSGELLLDGLRLSWGSRAQSDGVWQLLTLDGVQKRFYLSSQNGLFTLTLDAIQSAALSQARLETPDDTVLAFSDLGLSTEPGERIYAQIKVSPTDDYSDEYLASGQVSSNTADPLFGDGSSAAVTSLSKFRHLYNIRNFPADKTGSFRLDARALVWTGTPLFSDTVNGPAIGAFPAIPLLKAGDTLDGSAQLSYAITGLLLSASSAAPGADCLGLFQQVDGTVAGLTLKELVLDGTDAVFRCVGAVAGRCAGSIFDVRVNGTVSAVVSAGPSGQAGIGGVVGVAEGGGEVLSALTVTGSITGRIDALPDGEPVAGYDGADYCAAGVGGVAGVSSRSLSSCVNLADVRGNTRTGGVVGTLRGAAMTACRGEGLVLCTETDGTCIGGVAGYTWGGSLTDCVSAPGSGADMTAIDAQLLKGRYVGGVAGFCADSALDRCSTEDGGYVLGNAYVGGIAGALTGERLTAEAQLQNAACVIGNAYVGGIVGANADSIRGCVNNGLVVARLRYAGGITGYNTGSIQGCTSYLYDYGSRKYELAISWGFFGDYAGGIAGYNNGTIVYDASPDRSQNLAAIVIGGDYVGGIAGYNDADGVLRMEYDLLGGRLTGGDFVGGIAGLNRSESVSGGSAGLTVSPYGISGGNFVGGVFGANLIEASGDVTLRCRANNALSSISGRQYVGGLIGYQLLYSGGSFDALLAELRSSTKGTPRVFSLDAGSSGCGPCPCVYTLQGSEDAAANNVPILADRLAGGIVGCCEADTSLVISSCLNSANVSRRADSAAGIALTTLADVPLLEGYTGSLLGGICGYNAQSAVIQNCVNTGVISGESVLGGLCGMNLGRIEDCAVRSSIGAANADFVGGIAGLNAGVITGCSVADGLSVKAADCAGGLAAVNLGSIGHCSVQADVTSAGNMAGGAVGLNLGSFTLTRTLGDITVVGGDYVGGVIGQAQPGSELIVALTSDALSPQASVQGNRGVGGIIGLNAGDITTSEGAFLSNRASIHAALGSAGGIIGLQNGAAVLENAENHGAVDVDQGYAGGIVGWVDSEDFTLLSCVNCASVRNRYQGSSSDGQLAGGIVAVNRGVIDSCRTQTADGDLTITGRGELGGIAAENLGVIRDCSVAADGHVLTVAGSAQYLGGVVGVNQPEGRILRTTVQERGGGSLVLSASSGLPVLGGVAGRNCGVIDGEDGDALSPVALDITFPAAQYLGGVVGDNQGTLRGYHFTGTIHDTGSSGQGRCIGGIAGRNGGEANGALIENCHVTAAQNAALISAAGVYTASNTALHNEKAATSTLVGGVSGANYHGATLSHVTVDGAGGSESAPTLSIGSGILGGVTGYNDGIVESAGYPGCTLVEETLSALSADASREEKMAALDAAAQRVFAGLDETMFILLRKGGNGHVAGVVGLNGSDGLVQSCVSGRWVIQSRSSDPDSTTAGVIGLNEAEQELTCLLNFAAVTRSESNSNASGGVICRQENRTAGGWRLTLCGNWGRINSASRSAGIIGCIKYNCGVLENCWNRGVTKHGGIIGQIYRYTAGETMTLAGCVNRGAVSAGIVYSIGAFNKTDKLTCNIVDCVNYGAASNAGILAYTETGNSVTLLIQRCRNYGSTANGIVASSLTAPGKCTLLDCFGISAGAANPLTGYSASSLSASSDRNYYMDAASFSSALPSLAEDSSTVVTTGALISSYTFYYREQEYPGTAQTDPGHQSLNPAALLLDRDLDTRWAFKRASTANSDDNAVTVQFSFDQLTSLGSASFYWFNNSDNARRYSFVIEYRESADSAWYELAKGNSDKQNTSYQTAPQTVTFGTEPMATAMRVRITGNNTYVSLFELRLFDGNGSEIALPDDGGQPDVPAVSDSGFGQRLYYGDYASFASPSANDGYPAYGSALLSGASTAGIIRTDSANYFLSGSYIHCKDPNANVGEIILRMPAASSIQAIHDPDAYVLAYYARSSQNLSAPGEVTVSVNGQLNTVSWTDDGVGAYCYEVEVYAFESAEAAGDRANAFDSITGRRAYGAKSMTFSLPDGWSEKYFIVRVRACGAAGTTPSDWTQSAVEQFGLTLATPQVWGELVPAVTCDGTAGQSAFGYRFTLLNAEKYAGDWRVAVTLNNDSSTVVYLDADHPFAFSKSFFNSTVPLIAQAQLLDNGTVVSVSNRYSAQTNLPAPGSSLLTGLSSVHAEYTGATVGELACVVTLRRANTSTVPLYRVELVQTNDDGETVVAYKDLSLPSDSGSVTLTDLPADLFSDGSGAYVRAWLLETGMGPSRWYHPMTDETQTVKDTGYLDADPAHHGAHYDRVYTATSRIRTASMTETQYVYSAAAANKDALSSYYKEVSPAVPTLLPAPALGETAPLTLSGSRCDYCFSWDTPALLGEDFDAALYENALYRVAVYGLLNEDGQTTEILLSSCDSTADTSLTLDGSAWSYRQVKLSVARLGGAGSMGYSSETVYTLSTRLDALDRPTIVQASLNDILYDVSWLSLQDETNCSGYDVMIRAGERSELVTHVALAEQDKTVDGAVLRQADALDLEAFAGQEVELYIAARAEEGSYDAPDGITAPLSVPERMPVDALTILRSWDNTPLLASQFENGVGLLLTSDNEIVGNYVAVLLLYAETPAGVTAENWQDSGYEKLVGWDAPLTLSYLSADDAGYHYGGSFSGLSSRYAGYSAVFLVRGASQSAISSLWTASEPFTLPSIRLNAPSPGLVSLSREVTGAIFANDQFEGAGTPITVTESFLTVSWAIDASDDVYDRYAVDVLYRPDPASADTQTLHFTVALTDDGPALIQNGERTALSYDAAVSLGGTVALQGLGNIDGSETHFRYELPYKLRVSGGECVLLLPDPYSLLHGSAFSFTQSVTITAESSLENYTASQPGELVVH